MTNLKQFGLRVKQRREALELSQEKFAEVASLHRTYISGIERGARNPTLTVIQKLAKALKVKPGNLLD
jgi:transcriptional regulator with XRE-family HTH domain